MVSFQMKTSNRPQTIARVSREVDIKSFRENPEWYELVDSQEPTEIQRIVKPVKKPKEPK
jgi:hypothetical protein